MTELNFNNLKKTTMTLIFELNDCFINLNSMVHLLPIKKININQIKKTKKCKLPFCDIPGSIISLRYKDPKGNCIIRGIIKTQKFFKNSVAIDISTKIKNLSLKISPNKIQSCGAISRENCIEAINYIIEYFNDINDNINYIKNNIDDYNECVQWLEDNMKGEEFENIFYEEQNNKNMVLNIKHIEKVFEIKLDYNVPNHLNSRIINFLLKYTDEGLIYYSEYISKIKNILRFEPIYQKKISILSINEVMVNYNYKLGYKVDRKKLNELINGKNGFYSDFDPALSDCVTVELPYDDSKFKNKKKKNKIAHHTFLIYSSGAITQSGPGIFTNFEELNLMENAFNLFFKTIKEFENEIKFKI